MRDQDFTTESDVIHIEGKYNITKAHSIQHKRGAVFVEKPTQSHKRINNKNGYQSNQIHLCFFPS